VKLYVAKSEMTPSGIKFTFPRLQDKNSLSVKDDLVKRYKRQGRKVIYVGDGIWDIHALKEADYRYVVKGSRLATLCRENKIPAREITDFQELVSAIRYDLPA
jgi:2-hydroxy-3-keto-5-methylthiopentenyl-1-phosphate phosphatase